MWMFIVLGIVGVVTALLASPIVLKVELKEQVTVTLRFWFVKIGLYPRPPKTKKKPSQKQRKKPTAEESAEVEATPPQKEGTVKKIKQLFKVLSTLFHGSFRLLKGAKVKNLNLTLGITGEDAATAAIHYGQVCSIAYPFLGLIDAHMKLKNPKVNIYCDYLAEKPTIECSGKICVSVFHAVGTALFILKELIMKTIKK